MRAKELWRIPEPYLAEAQDDATVLAIKAQEDAGLDIITDGEIRRESYSNRFATALEGIDIDEPGVALDRSGHPNPVPRIVGPIRRKRPVEVDDLKFLRAHTTRKVKMTVPGPFTMSQQAQNDYYPNLAEAALAYAEAVNAEIKDLFAAGADIVQIDEPYMQARPGPARGIWTCGAEPGARGRERRDRRAYLLRLCGDHPRAPERLFVPAAAQGLPLPADLDRDGAIESRLLGAQGIAGPDDHPRRARSVDAGDRNARDGRGAHPPRLAYRKPEDIIVAPDCGLKYLPRDAAFGKMKAMVEGARIVRAELRRNRRTARVCPTVRPEPLRDLDLDHSAHRRDHLSRGRARLRRASASGRHGLARDG